jgi:hypothetical protein
MFGHAKKVDVDALQAKVNANYKVGEGANFIEPWYGVPVHQETIDLAQMQEWYGATYARSIRLYSMINCTIF